MTEAFPLVLIEAWQSGIPVVCSEFATISEIERTYAGGDELAWHVPCPPSANQLAEAVQEVGDGDDRVGQAQRLAMTVFNATAMVGRWEKLFYHCVAEWQALGANGLIRNNIADA